MAANEQEIERLVVRLTGDGSSYQKMLKEAESSSKAVGAAIQNATAKVEGFASKAVSAAASLGIGEFLKMAKGEWQQAELAQLKLKAAIEASGNSVDSVLPGYEALAAKIQKTTVLSDETAMALLRQAESFNLSGKRAEEATQISIALSGAINGTAESAENYMRVANAIVKGDMQQIMHMKRMIPQLREVKTEEEARAKIQHLLATGMKTVAAEAQSGIGKAKIAANLWSDAMEDVGRIFSELLNPIKLARAYVLELWNSASEETKRAIVYTAAIAAALLAIGPALLTLKLIFVAAFAPVGMAITAVVTTIAAIKAALLFLLSPIGLVTIALGGLVYYIVTQTELASKAVAWFGEQWTKLSDSIGPAITKIKEALAAGDISLAFKIAWAQIKLTFAQATFGIATYWEELKRNFKIGINEIQYWWLTTWGEVELGFVKIASEIIKVSARMAAEVAVLAGKLTREQAEWHVETIRGHMAFWLNKKITEYRAAQEALQKARVEGNLNAMKVHGEHIKALEEEIAALQKQRDAVLLEKPKEKEKVKAFDAIKDNLAGAMAKGAEQGRERIDAALRGSAESIARVQAFRDLMRLPSGDKAVEKPARNFGGFGQFPAGIPGQFPDEVGNEVGAAVAQHQAAKREAVPDVLGGLIGGIGAGMVGAVEKILDNIHLGKIKPPPEEVPDFAKPFNPNDFNKRPVAQSEIAPLVPINNAMLQALQQAVAILADMKDVIEDGGEVDIEAAGL